MLFIHIRKPKMRPRKANDIELSETTIIIFDVLIKDDNNQMFCLSIGEFRTLWDLLSKFPGCYLITHSNHTYLYNPTLKGTEDFKRFARVIELDASTRKPIRLPKTSRDPMIVGEFEDDEPDGIGAFHETQEPRQGNKRKNKSL